jgi:perosamine synthetase
MRKAGGKARMIYHRTIPVAHPMLGGNEQKYVLECLETSWVSSTGKFVKLFEDAFARYSATGHGIACNSGTSALHLALAGLGVGQGDEVIVPTLTFVATANAVRYCGAQPVFIDSEPQTMTLNPQLLESCLTTRTKGIIVVHLYGHPADMRPIIDFARAHGLFVIEDAAEAHGALYRGRKVGGLGDAAAFSFYGNKIITTGEGGMVTTSDDDLCERIRILRGHGMDPASRYWFPVIGYNYRMTNIAAAIGLAQLEQIESFLDHRIAIALAYEAALESLGDCLILPSQRPWAKHAFWSYPIVLRDRVLIERDYLMSRLQTDGIETRPVFYPMHMLPPYREVSTRFPVAELLARRGITLPMHALLSREDVIYIAERIGHWCRMLSA